MDGRLSEPPHSRPMTPESPLANSLYHATSNIDDLTLALANFSRVPSPEPPSRLPCCCGRDDCIHTTSWMALKSRLESRLILSAEVGQALLQRHEAYVRRHEGRNTKRPRPPPEIREGSIDEDVSLPELDSHLVELVKEKTILQKRLNQALVNNEVNEVSNQTILQELQEARTTITRLTAHHARSLGWDTRLSAAMKERDDMQQERDSEMHRARVAESRFAALKERTSKLQAEVRRLYKDLEDRQLHRLESSESILQDARLRLDTLHKLLGHNAVIEQAELTKVLESLVDDNETLKRDNAELQNLLAESREDLHALQEEVEEQRANQPHTGANTPYSRSHHRNNSVPSIHLKEPTIYSLGRRSTSTERRARNFEPLTPETGRRPLSPADSLAPSETKWTSFSQPQPRYPSSHISFEVDDDAGHGDTSSEKAPTHKSLLLLNRSRGVQTDTWPGLLSVSPFPYISSHDPRSESSSFSDSLSSNISVLLERVSNLLVRMSQADALTLTNRLKRQHLRGADVGHLSRSTVNNIVSEVTSLRIQFRTLLEDDRAPAPCTRKDLRVLFKLLRDIFTEMGQMRVTLNDVILDPAIAPKVSEQALDPTKAEADREKEREREQEGASNSGAGGWMAPISKLFSPSSRGTERPTLFRSASGRGAARPPRFIPKLGPALSASATTVNVEFSGAGVGRSQAVTSTISTPVTITTESAGASEVPQSSAGVMGIFAGAPRSTTPDPWVVLPRGPRRVQSTLLRPPSESPAVFRRPMTGSGGGMSRDVDAVIDVASPIRDDDEEADEVPPLLERTLRRRGLSDSSIHSTYTSQADEARAPAPNGSTATVAHHSPSSLRLDQSVLQALSRTVQSFRIVSGAAALTGPDGDGDTSGASLSPPPHTTANTRRHPPGRAGTVRAASAAAATGAGTGLGTLLSSWAGAGPDPFVVRSLREESTMVQQRARMPREAHGRDYF